MKYSTWYKFVPLHTSIDLRKIKTGKFAGSIVYVIVLALLDPGHLSEHKQKKFGGFKPIRMDSAAKRS